MERVNASQAREDFAELLNRVAYAGERVVLHRRGKNVAALVSMEDLELLEAMEERQDAAELNRAIKEWEKEGRPTAPLAQVEAELKSDQLEDLVAAITPENRHAEKS